MVNPEQAETVRLIFKLFLEGMSPHSIARELTSRDIKSPGGKDTWNQQTVRRMLSNEKYKGDALLQKEFTVDFLEKKMKKNEGEVPQYYVEGKGYSSNFLLLPLCRPATLRRRSVGSTDIIDKCIILGKTNAGDVPVVLGRPVGGLANDICYRELL